MTTRTFPGRAVAHHHRPTTLRAVSFIGRNIVTLFATAAIFPVSGIAIASGDPGVRQARDVEFRATGNEPGWFLEISAKKQIVLVTDYGQKRYAFPDAKAPSDPHARNNVLHAANDEHRLEVILESKPCMDTMSDEQFDTRVTVRLDDRELHGCGRSLH